MCMMCTEIAATTITIFSVWGLIWHWFRCHAARASRPPKVIERLAGRA